MNIICKWNNRIDYGIRIANLEIDFYTKTIIIHEGL